MTEESEETVERYYGTDVAQGLEVMTELTRRKDGSFDVNFVVLGPIPPTPRTKGEGDEVKDCNEMTSAPTQEEGTE